MHAYLAFIIYIRGKAKSECTGIEKHVKQCIEANTIGFFPINRCLAIPDAEAF